MDGADTSPVLDTAAGSGGRRALVERLLEAMHDGRTAVLGLVVATEGSTYAKPGAALLFGDGALRHGWISGGCLEPGLEADAQAVAASGQVRCIALDTRGDEDLLFGSRIGCRGLLHVALLPVASLRSLQAPLRAWCTRDVALQLVLTRAHLRIACSDGGDAAEAVLAWDRTEAAVPADGWTLHWPAAPRLLLFGAGPESSTLLPWLRRLGWYVDLVERRPRWRGAGALADRLIDLAPASVPVARSGYAAALVMHHDFELDREALAALAAAPPAFVGLLGPPARRDDLLSLLDAPARAALAGPLHAPVGLDLGGRGPESIALAIVAQLQARVMAVRAA